MPHAIRIYLFFDNIYYGKKIQGLMPHIVIAPSYGQEMDDAGSRVALPLQQAQDFTVQPDAAASGKHNPEEPKQEPQGAFSCRYRQKDRNKDKRHAFRWVFAYRAGACL